MGVIKGFPGDFQIPGNKEEHNGKRVTHKATEGSQKASDGRGGGSVPPSPTIPPNDNKTKIQHYTAAAAEKTSLYREVACREMNDSSAADAL